MQTGQDNGKSLLKERSGVDRREALTGCGK